MILPINYFNMEILTNVCIFILKSTEKYLLFNKFINQIVYQKSAYKWKLEHFSTNKVSVDTNIFFSKKNIHIVNIIHS